MNNNLARLLPLLLVLTSLLDARKIPRPNIVLMMADDMG